MFCMPSNHPSYRVDIKSESQYEAKFERDSCRLDVASLWFWVSNDRDDDAVGSVFDRL